MLERKFMLFILRSAFILFCLVMLFGCGGEPAAPPEPTLSPIVQAGRSHFQIHCATCHATVPDVTVVGPSLAGISTTASTRVANQTAQEYILMSILRPDDFIVQGFAEAMPKDFGKKLTGEEVDAIVAYLLTLE
jgi:mono/diheme cytochrome c family protein